MSEPRFEPIENEARKVAALIAGSDEVAAIAAERGWTVSRAAIGKAYDGLYQQLRRGKIRGIAQRVTVSPYGNGDFVDDGWCLGFWEIPPSVWQFVEVFPQGSKDNNAVIRKMRPGNAALPADWPKDLAVLLAEIEIDAAAVEQIWSIDRRSGVGRPPTANWDAVMDALRLEVDKRGMPDAENTKGWRRQADVERWIADILADRNEEAGTSTIKTHASEMLKALGYKKD